MAAKKNKITKTAKANKVAKAPTQAPRPRLG